jgi:hypothetical protein
LYCLNLTMAVSETARFVYVETFLPEAELCIRSIGGVIKIVYI